MKRKALKAAFPHTIPVMTGYLVLGISYGVLITSFGFPFWMPMVTSLTIFAGSMEFVLVNLLLSGFDLLQAFLMTLMINARHLFYGISMVDAYKGAGKKKPYLIFALTDETYSLVSQNQIPEGISRHSYCFLVSLFDHIYWVTGSVLGSLAGSLLPINYEGIEFVLTALFVTIFVEQWLSTKNHAPAIIGVAATAACLAIFGKDVFLIPSMVIIALLLTLMRKTGRREQNA